MNDPDKFKNPKKLNRDPNIIKLDPGTLLLIITALLLVPLILTGFSD
jgi:hypothetical protein